MEIIRVIAMTDGPMPAARPVLVGVVVPMVQGAASFRPSMFSPGSSGQEKAVGP